MEATPDPLATADTVDDVPVVDATPSLLWVLFTRLDGVLLVVSVAGLLYLLVKAVVSVNKELSSVTRQLAEMQTKVAEVHVQSPRKEDREAAVLARIEQRVALEQREHARVVREKDAEVERLLRIVEDAAGAAAAAERAEAVLTGKEAQLQAAKRQLADVEAQAGALQEELATAAEDNERLRQHAAALEAQLDTTERKLKQTSTVWDLLVETEKNAAREPLPPRPTPPAPLARVTTPRAAHYPPPPPPAPTPLPPYPPAAAASPYRAPAERPAHLTAVSGKAATPTANGARLDDAGTDAYLAHLEQQISMYSESGL